jgi:cathepsin A (carboxypeptidase C)
MKLNAVLLSALAVCATAIDLGHSVDQLSNADEFSFQMPSELGISGLSSYGGLVRTQVARILSEMANELGQSWEDIPDVAVNSWHEVLKTAPELFGQLKSELFKQLTKPNRKTPPSPSNNHIDTVDWMHVVENQDFPDYSLKVKSPDSLGIDTVKQYAGYLDVDDEDKHFFYWFFESRNDPKKDPIVLWLNGGPGCSSLTGLFFELGPASINVELAPVHNPHSWNNNASVIFLDQPVNTGYSYSDGSSVSDSVTAAKDVYAFLSLFFQQFPEYNHLSFHIAGESYAGHYIPVIASEILAHDKRAFNLSSVLIGNGLTDPLRQYDYYEPMACGKGGEPSVLSEQECQGMIDSQPRCDALIDACYNSQSAWTCVPATIYCNNAMMGPYQRTGKNVYDIRTDCEDSSLCYSQLETIDKYLNQPFVMKAVGARVDSFSSCNFDVNRNFLFAGDWMKPYYTNVVNILEQGLPVLIYAGDKDFICNWLGNEAWSKELEWSGGDEFSDTPLEAWTYNGEEVGQVRNAGTHFTFLRVYGAGHMVPYDQPESAMEMFNRWIGGDFTYN